MRTAVDLFHPPDKVLAGGHLLNLDPEEARAFFDACEKDDEGQVGVDRVLGWTQNAHTLALSYMHKANVFKIQLIEQKLNSKTEKYNPTWPKWQRRPVLTCFGQCLHALG